MPPKPRTSVKRPVVSKKNAETPKASSTESISENTGTTSGLSQEAENQFELELCWCIQQLEMCLATGKLPEKQVHDLNKNINILKSNSAPLIKKRQVMRNTLGNYREKMALDEQKHGKTASSIKFMPPPSRDKKCIFFKKAAANKKQETQSDKASTDSKEDSIDTDDVQTAFKFNFQIKE